MDSSQIGKHLHHWEKGLSKVSSATQEPRATPSPCCTLPVRLTFQSEGPGRPQLPNLYLSKFPSLGESGTHHAQPPRGSSGMSESRLLQSRALGREGHPGESRCCASPALRKGGKWAAYLGTCHLAAW